MPRPRQQEIATLQEFFQFIDQRRSTAFGPLWYRGCASAGYQLQPSIFRHPTKNTIQEIEKLEQELISRFRQRSLPFHGRSLSSDWDTLFFMQHHGIPTRLLDWSENPLVGLFFAVMYARPTRNPTPTGFLSDAAVWVLDPVAWNRHALRYQSFQEGVLSVDDIPLGSYKPASSYNGMNNHPVALYGAHNSQRIVAQRGVFTVFGRDVRPMESAFEHDNFPSDVLIKLLFRRVNIGGLRRALTEYGITDSVVFPDLDGLSREIRRYFGFEV